MGGRWGAGLVRVLAVSLLRKDVLLILAVTLSIPAAVGTAYSMVPEVVAYGSEALMNYFAGRDYVRVAGVSCPGCPQLVTAYVVRGNSSIRAYAIFTERDRLNRILVAQAGECLEKEGSWNASVGVLLSHVAGIGVGDVVRVCYPEGCVVAEVGCVHQGIGPLPASIVLIGGSTGGGHAIEIVRASPYVAPLINELASIINSFAWVFSLAVSVAYTPMMYVGARRVRELMSEEVTALHCMGVSLGDVLNALSASLTLLSAVMIVFGISLGVVVMHAALWGLRYLGMIVPVRPLPNPLGVAVLSASLATAFSIASWAGTRGDGSE